MSGQHVCLVQVAITYKGAAVQHFIPEETYAGNTETVVTGWGTTEVFFIPGVGSFSLSPSPILLKTSVNPVSNGVCGAAMGEGRILDGMICASAENKDTCQVIIVKHALIVLMMLTMHTYRETVEVLW